MPPKPVKLFHPQSDQPVAVVSVEPSSSAGAGYLVRLGLGKKLGQLSAGQVYGPYPEDQLEGPFQEAVQQLVDQGYLPLGHHSTMHKLYHGSPRVKRAAALRLGWIGGEAAEAALLEKLNEDDDCRFACAEALGRLRGAGAVGPLLELARLKPLYRRRPAAEALFLIDQQPTLNEARQLTLQRLPEPIRNALLGADEPDEPADQPDAAQEGQTVEAITEAFKAVAFKRRGAACDDLYELGQPASVDAALRLIEALPFNAAFCWRYVKSVFKRSMIRDDLIAFGRLAYLIEKRGLAGPTGHASVKSGFDGKQRHTSLFGPKTRDWLRRGAWRHLKRLARFRPELYPYAAAEAIVHYELSDARELNPPMAHRLGPFAHCYLLNRVLYHNSERLTFHDRSMKFRYRSASKRHRSAPTDPQTREEAFPELWDAQPSACLRLLVDACLPEVQRFALKVAQRSEGQAMAVASPGQLLAMLEAALPEIVELSLAELDRRFDPERPDWDLIAQVAGSLNESAAPIGQGWLRATGHLWARDEWLLLRMLTLGNPASRVLAGQVASEALEGDREACHAAAPLMLEALRSGEGEEGQHEGIAVLCRGALRLAIYPLLGVEDLLELIATGSTSAQSVAADQLADRPEAVEQVSLADLTALAEHILADVRSAAHSLLRHAEPTWREDPSTLMAMLDSKWPDTRAAAMEAVQRCIDEWVQRAGVEAVMGLLDSNRPDVQKRGRELTSQHLRRLDPALLVERLVEHPHPSMRKYALDLIDRFLPAGAEALGKVEGLCRSAMMDLWPSRPVKRRVLKLLSERGLTDEAQAQVAARVLDDVVRFQGRADFEAALEALVRIKLTFPAVASRLSLVGSQAETDASGDGLPLIEETP